MSFIALLVQQFWMLLYLFWLYFILPVSQQQTSAREMQWQVETLSEFQNAMNINIIGFQLMHRGFSLEFILDLSHIRLLDKDLSKTDLDLLETNIDSYLVNILLVCKTSGRWPQDISSWSRLQNMSLRRLQETSEINKFLLDYRAI